MKEKQTCIFITECNKDYPYIVLTLQHETATSAGSPGGPGRPCSPFSPGSPLIPGRPSSPESPFSPCVMNVTNSIFLQIFKYSFLCINLPKGVFSEA